MQRYKKNQQRFTGRCRILVFVLLFSLSSPLLFSQSQSSTADKVTLKQALGIIERRSNVLFAYSNDNLDLSQLVDRPQSGIPIKEILDNVFKGTGNKYQFQGKYILISKAQEQEVQPIQRHNVPVQQVRNELVKTDPLSVAINGIVVDTDTGLALRGAQIKSSGVETVTDVGGRFQINGANEGKNTIVVSCPGYNTVEHNIVITTDTDQLVTISLKTADVYVTQDISPTKFNQNWSFKSPDANTRFARSNSRSSSFGIKTNLLYAAAAQTPNLGIEFGLGQKTTLELSGGYNPWNREGSVGDNKKLVHFLARTEFRYWLCERFNGHFFGAHALYSNYNISGHDIPMLFEKAYRYEGFAAGAGVTYGYHLMLGKNWGLEFSVGVGAAYLNYDKHSCEWCGEELGNFKKTYIGPTKAGISLVYVIK